LNNRLAFTIEQTQDEQLAFLFSTITAATWCKASFAGEHPERGRRTKMNEKRPMKRWRGGIRNTFVLFK
jgi:hypothetical protein